MTLPAPAWDIRFPMGGLGGLPVVIASERTRRPAGSRRAHLFRLVAAALLLGFVLLLLGCGVGTPQNTFAPEGEVADKQRDLFNLVLWPAVAILVIVEGLLVIALMRFRQRRGQEPLPRQVHGNPRLEVAWTIAPAVLLLVLAVPTVASIIDLGREPAKDALPVRVTGFQWNWMIEYPEFTDAEGNPLRIIGTCPTSCAEMHVPVGREIAVSLEASDVVHSFWIPKLAGKLDAIPGRTNRMWFNATTPGRYSGQCAEFCGLGHTDMRLFVVAESEAEFQAWVNEQLGEQQAAQSGSGQPGVASYGE